MFTMIAFAGMVLEDRLNETYYAEYGSPQDNQRYEYGEQPDPQSEYGSHKPHHETENEAQESDDYPDDAAYDTSDQPEEIKAERDTHYPQENQGAK